MDADRLKYWPLELDPGGYNCPGEDNGCGRCRVPVYGSADPKPPVTGSKGEERD